MLKQEQQERAYLKAHPDENRNLYPTLNDALFNVKIAEKKEFNDTQYDGTVYDVKKQADILANAEFELQPHQLFVRNFMSFNTPYNSLLLYHGLGSGKTCSAIGVCEEMRDYLKQTGLDKKIIIVASPNVQDNFRLQLFDERKLKKVGNTWTMGGCIGDKLLKEIQPSGMKPIEREKIQSQIKSLINNYYEFVGYTEFSNYLEKKSKVIKSEFSNRLIVIDEVHNIIDEGQNVSKTAGQTIKKIASQMIKLVKASENVRLLLLSATPMYNSYKEILWLINLMNINDKRASISISDIFDKEGEFKEPSGKELFMQKITGYVSYVRGENPYTFPYKVYPHLFSPQNTYAQIRRPTIQMNTKEIKPEDAMQNLNLFLTKIGPYQQKGYDYIINSYYRKQLDESAVAFEDMQSFGYTILRLPLEALNMVYPMDIDFAGGAGSSSEDSSSSLDRGEEEGEGEESEEESEEDGASIRVSELTGIHGLERMMNFENSKSRGTKGGFSYKESTLSKYGRIFSHKEIGKYSCKIKNICDNLAGGCQGIVMIYSEYLDAGLIPAVLAIEELGFVRFQGGGGKTLLTEKAAEKEIRGNYAFISGDKRLSPDNNKEIKALTNDNNKNGEKIKIVFISRAGAEGLDLKFIRQVHILEPWYNLNRVEQIIGRAVRNFSHKELPFEKRNVQVFLYGTVLRDENVEAADVYVYRFAEAKSIKIGKITRLMKETSVDCILNHNQTNFTISNMKQEVEQVLSNKMVLSKFKVGDEPFSSACDYMGDCEYRCVPNKDIRPTDIREENYNEKYIATNTARIIQKIKKLFYDKYLYKKAILIGMINTPKPYPTAQIYYAITQMIENRDILIDKYNRQGYLINNGEYYLFQPAEIQNKNISLFEREFPQQFKPEKILIRGEKEPEKDKDKDNDTGLEIKPDMDLTLDKMEADYELARESYLKISENSDYKVPRGDDNWFKHCGITIYKLEKEGYDRKALFKMVVEHIVDIMSFRTKLHVLNHVFSTKVDGIFKEMREYFEDSFIMYKSLVSIILYDDQTSVILKLNGGKKWSVASEMEQRDILKQYKEKEETVANVVGFMQYDKKTDSFMFKIKNNTLAKNLGASCEQMNKIKKIETLNLILGEKRYTSENTRGMVQSELCSLIEFILREKTRKTESVWFYDNEIKLKKN